MNSAQRIETIKERLKKFSPVHLEVIDDSAAHAGHAGSAGGAGHYTVIIQAECFKNKNRVDIHRQIYQELNDMIPQEIHALVIKSLAY